MPATLNEGAQVQIPATTIDRVKVAAFKVEDNIERWISIWLIYGSMVEGEFVEYIDPATGLPVPPTHIKLEIGHHPLAPGTALRKCPNCGKWFQLETQCDEPECNGQSLAQYDGLVRAMMMTTSSNKPYLVMKEAIYTFLSSEQVPDPVTWEERPILDAGTWE